MGLGTLIGARQRVQFIQSQIGTVITVDCTVQETHSRESPPTEFEVENGQTISDHIIVKPFALEIQGVISDTPLNLNQLGLSALTTIASSVLPPVGIILGGAGVALYSALSQSKSPSVAAFGQLLQLQETKQPFDVLTTLKRYASMWIKSISVPRDASTGRALQFTLQLVQLIIISPQTVNIKQFSDPSMSAKQIDAGNQQLQNTALSRTQQGVADGLAVVGAR